MNSNSSKHSVEYNNIDTFADSDEKIINWEEEATAIINDVKTHVTEIEISRKLPSDESIIYLNIRTIEGRNYCVHASSMGFRVVANEYDTIDANTEADEDEVYETPYALLDKISPSYVQSFGNQLCKQLLSLQQMRTQFNEEDEEDIEEAADITTEADDSKKFNS